MIQVQPVEHSYRGTDACKVNSFRTYLYTQSAHKLFLYNKY
jgi:hypothetical protein